MRCGEFRIFLKIRAIKSTLTFFGFLQTSDSSNSSKWVPFCRLALQIQKSVKQKSLATSQLQLKPEAYTARWHNKHQYLKDRNSHSIHVQMISIIRYAILESPAQLNVCRYGQTEDDTYRFQLGEEQNDVILSEITEVLYSCRSILCAKSVTAGRVQLEKKDN